MYATFEFRTWCLLEYVQTSSDLKIPAVIKSNLAWKTVEAQDYKKIDWSIISLCINWLTRIYDMVWSVLILGASTTNNQNLTSA